MVKEDQEGSAVVVMIAGATAAHLDSAQRNARRTSNRQSSHPRSPTSTTSHLVLLRRVPLACRHTICTLCPLNWPIFLTFTSSSVSAFLGPPSSPSVDEQSHGKSTTNPALSQPPPRAIRSKRHSPWRCAESEGNAFVYTPPRLGISR